MDETTSLRPRNQADCSNLGIRGQPICYLHVQKSTFHGRARHVDIKYHFVREQVTKGNIELKYCRTKDIIAGMLTKDLIHAKFTKLRYMAGVRPRREQSAGE